MPSPKAVVLAAGGQQPRGGYSQGGVVRCEYIDSLLRITVSKARQKISKIHAEGKKNIVINGYVMN
jgi:hypothetical protein